MAVSINRVITDGNQTATIELVSTGTGAPGGEGGTIIDLSTLSQADGSGTESARVIRVQAIVSSEVANGGTVSLIWGGAGIVFLTLGVGSHDIQLVCDPASGANSLIGYQTSEDNPFTLRLYLEKLNGFPGSMAKFNRLL